jgi:dienelactone hydrolase
MIMTGVLVGLLAVSTAEKPPVRIAGVEIAPSSYNGPGRVFRKVHPARFQMTLVNLTDQSRDGTLAGEVVGNLNTVYGLPTETIRLEPHERRSITWVWDYPGTVDYESVEGASYRLPSPRWGHTLHVAWRENGSTMSRSQLVFGVESAEGIFKEHENQAAPVDPRRDFEMRYTGYMTNPAIRKIDVPGDFTLRLSRGKIRAWRRGTGPAGWDTCVLDLDPCSEAASAVLDHRSGSHRLLTAWLLEPDQVAVSRSKRLRHLSDLKIYRFTVPMIPRGAALILELGPSHYVPPVPLNELVKLAEAKFRAFPGLLRNHGGKPISTTGQWAEHRKQRKQAIREALGLAAFESRCSLEPKLVSEEAVSPQMHVNGWAGSYLRRKVSIQVRTGERMNVWLLIPPGLGPFPAMIALHQTVIEGKDEPVGLGGNVWQLNYGPFLASRGFVVASADSPTFGERFDPMTEQALDTTRFEANDPHWSLLGRRLADHTRVIDYLETQPLVAANRIGAIGHSLGGESVTVLTAMDERIKAAVISCGFTLLRSLEHAGETYAAKGHVILPPALRSRLDAPIGRRDLPFSAMGPGRCLRLAGVLAGER